MGWVSLILETDYVQSLLLFLSFFFFASILDFLMKKYGEKIQDQSKVLGKICEISHRPIYFLLMFTGIYLAVQVFTLGPKLDMWVDRSFFVVEAMLVAYVLSKISSAMVTSWLKVNRRYEKTPELINKIIAVIIYVIATLVVLDHFNIEISPIIATLGLGGLAIGLALQDTLKDFFAGLHIISDRPIRVGDHIEIEKGPSGYVEDIGWRSTRIRTLPNTYIVLPNSKIATSTIENHSMPVNEMSIRIQVGVDYTSDLERVEDATIEVAKKIQEEVEGAVDDFEPFIRFHTFGDNNINFTVILRVNEFVDKYRVTNEFMKRLHEKYKEKGIEISWPIRKVYDMQKKSSKRRDKSSDSKKK